jgi:hypothetical protein
MNLAAGLKRKRRLAPMQPRRGGELPPGVAYMPKPWQPLNLLIAAEQALASRV